MHPNIDAKTEVFTLIRYGLVGAANTAVTAFVMGALALAGTTYPVYTACGYAAGIVFSYFANARYTFRRPAGTGPTDGNGRPGSTDGARRADRPGEECPPAERDRPAEKRPPTGECRPTPRPKSARAGAVRFALFAGVCLGLLACAQIIQYLLIERAGTSEFTGVACAMVFYTAAGFLINRFVVFVRSA